MSLEAIRIVCAAEEDARQARELAQRKAQEAIEETHRGGKESVASALARAESEIAYLVRVSDQKATKDAMELASQTANRQAAMQARAHRRLGAAAQVIYERIVNA